MSFSMTDNDVELRPTTGGKRPLAPGGDDDMVATHTSTTATEISHTKYTEATLLRDDLAKARAEEISWYDKFEAYEEVTDETCMSRAGRRHFSSRWKDIRKGDNEGTEVRSRFDAREIKQNGNRQLLRGSATAGTRTVRDQRGCDENEIRKMTTTHGTILHASILARWHF